MLKTIKVDKELCAKFFYRRCALLHLFGIVIVVTLVLDYLKTDKDILEFIQQEIIRIILLGVIIIVSICYFFYNYFLWSTAVILPAYNTISVSLRVFFGIRVVYQILSVREWKIEKNSIVAVGLITKNLAFNKKFKGKPKRAGSIAIPNVFNEIIYEAFKYLKEQYDLREQYLA